MKQKKSHLTFVRQLTQLGIAVIPLYHRSKEPILSTWREFQSRLPTEQELNLWFPTDWNNYAVICGWNNLVVIDFDNIEYFNIWQLVQPDICNAAFKVRTRNGMHVYLTTEYPSANDKRIARSGGIDVQAQGRYVVGPLCTHPSGHVYEPIGEMIFPVVSSVESILPLDLFPRVRAEEIIFNGVAPTFAESHTEYQSQDAFDLASRDSVDLISKIKASVRIESLFPRAVRSSTDGRWLKALCPFHRDTHESFWIDTRRQLCGCQVCGMKPMDAIDLFGRMHNLNSGDAVIALAHEVGVWK